MIVLVGQASWIRQVKTTLQASHTVVAVFTDKAHYMKTLIDEQVVMIFVDASLSNWDYFVTTPKASPATRRIPIAVVNDDATQRAIALDQGAELILSVKDVINDMEQFIADFGRITDPDTLKQLDCECQKPLPERAEEGIKQFNAGDYYQQHDLLEEEWVETSGPVRDLYRAILQVGVAYYQIERGNYRGALKMLQRSVQWLVRLPDRCQGVNVQQLRHDSFRVRAELERLGEAHLSSFDKSLLKNVQLLPPRDAR